MERESFTPRDMELLVALYYVGSLQGAARRLECTSSALSHRIHEAEARLGVALVERHGKLQLTPKAKRLLPRAEHILQEIVLLRQDLQGESAIRRIGISSLVLEGAVLEGFQDILEIETHVHYEVRTGHSTEITNWVERGTVDVGIVRLERMRPGLRYDLLSDDRLVAVARAPFVETNSMASWPWVLFSSRMGHGQVVSRTLSEVGLFIQPRVIVDSLALAVALVERGYVSVLPWSMVGEQVLSGRLVELSLEEVIWPSRRTVLLTQPMPPPWISTLLRALRRRMSCSSE